MEIPSNGHHNLDLDFDFRRICVKLIFASALYTSLGLYLYLPYLDRLTDRMVLLASIVAALGCFVISTRWIGSFAAELLTGAVYGFCPFVLGFTAYHSLAMLPAAVMPWLFCPAVFYQARKRGTRGQNGIGIALCLLPFAAMIGFFMFLSSQRLFPVPVAFGFDAAGIAGLIAPLSLKPHTFIAGLYHVPAAMSLCGLMIYIRSRRYKIMMIVAPALVLAMGQPIFETPPVVWGLIVMLFASVLAGLGTQSLALAGKNDSKWILICILIICAVAALTLMLSRQLGFIYAQTARIHSLAVVLLGIVFLLAESGIRFRSLRWSLLIAAVAADLIGGARFIIDTLL
ncbi:MAG: hypothetical protein KAJ07_05690 [Planctomycetes bacterium]|nr:hypothetical protein [Planctomycetota bacterium]